jgi:outer membrane lipoprotein-sorting protein
MNRTIHLAKKNYNVQMKTIMAVAMCLIGITAHFNSRAQDADALIKKVKEKLAAVNDYQAEGTLRTDVSFMKVPESKVTIFYKKPDKFKIKKQDGISIVPKGGVNINLSALFAGNNYTAVPAGKSQLNRSAVTIIKLLPLDENSDVVVSTLYIDETAALIKKSVITTRENGTYEMEMEYGRYATRGLPDKIVFIFATKDYKLPKGLAFDYDTGNQPKNNSATGNQKGKIEIAYSSYTINKGIADDTFK